MRGVSRPMRRAPTLAALALPAIALLSCVRPAAEGRSVESDTWRFSVFVRGVASWPYDMPEPRRAVLLHGYRSLAVGQSKEEVERILGAPDAEWFALMRSGSSEIRTPSWGYYVHREEAELARPGDKVVFVEFTPAGTLLRAYALNLDLPRIGADG